MSPFRGSSKTATLVGVLGVMYLVGVAARTRKTDLGELAPAASGALGSVEKAYSRDLDSLEQELGEVEATGRLGDTAGCRAAFRRARGAYKRVQYLAEYFSQPAALLLNAPYVARADDDDPEVPVPPTGFQVMEASLFPKVATDFASRIEIQSEIMRPALQQLRLDQSSVVESESRVFDAMRLEIGRVLTLGLAGFDTGLSGDAILEAQQSLSGLRSGLDAYAVELRTANPAAADALDERLRAAAVYLRDHPDFVSFNRLAFIVVYGGPLASALGEAQRALHIPRIANTEGWSSRTDGIFDRGAMNPIAYAPWDAARPAQPVLSLGRRLFFEPKLSAGRLRSCATCHQPARLYRRAGASAGESWRRSAAQEYPDPAQCRPATGALRRPAHRTAGRPGGRGDRKSKRNGTLGDSSGRIARNRPRLFRVVRGRVPCGR